LAGSAVAQFISAVDHWVAFGLLAYVGITMIRSGSSAEVVSYRRTLQGEYAGDASVATSLDAMAVGF